MFDGRVEVEKSLAEKIPTHEPQTTLTKVNPFIEDRTRPILLAKATHHLQPYVLPRPRQGVTITTTLQDIKEERKLLGRAAEGDEEGGL